MSRVMISYRNIDGQREFAASLERVLAKAGVETWLDKKNIPPLSRWEDEIFKGIIGSDCVVLCLSPEYFESETCRFECYVARGYGKKLLPIVVPYDSNVSIFDFIDRFEETRGLDHLNIISFHSREILGLQEDYTTLTHRLIKSITSPIPPDSDYDVYFSFRWRQASFATEIADDLNDAGIKAFVHTRSLDVGTDWRRASWNAALKSKVHVVILTPDVDQSEYIRNEVLISRTKKDIHFVPILAKEFASDESAKTTIRRTFSGSKNLSLLNDIQWFIPNGSYTTFIKALIDAIRVLVNRN